jgi:hypothetical protein
MAVISTTCVWISIAIDARGCQSAAPAVALRSQRATAARCPDTPIPASPLIN